MSESTGGDVHGAYAEMGTQGGEARKEQMASEHGGDATQGYSEMVGACLLLMAWLKLLGAGGGRGQAAVAKALGVTTGDFWHRVAAKHAPPPTCCCAGLQGSKGGTS